MFPKEKSSRPEIIEYLGLKDVALATMTDKDRFEISTKGYTIRFIILGDFNRETKELSFEVKEEWLEKGVAMEFYYFKNYLSKTPKILSDTFDNKKESFCSLLLSKIVESGLLLENPFEPMLIMPEDNDVVRDFKKVYGNLDSWKEAESKLASEKWLILLF